MVNQKRINQYIEAHKLSWADSTQKTEKYRLQALLPYTQVMDDCTKLYNKLVEDGYKPYSIKTMFIRMGNFYDHFGFTNIYRDFLNSHARLFKSAYTREQVSISFNEATKRILKIKDSTVREAAQALLSSGLRSCEIEAVVKGVITGKGNKKRPFLASSPPPKVSRSALWRGLKSVGLKPHTLRKLFATRLVEKGLDINNLCHVMGWSNLNTAQFYLQPKKDSELKKFIAEAVRA